MAGVLYGFRPVVVAIVCEAVLRLGKRAIRRRWHLVVSSAAFVVIYFLGVPFPVIVLLAALAGWAASQMRPAPPEHEEATKVVAPTRGEHEGPGLVIDDDSPPRTSIDPRELQIRPKKLEERHLLHDTRNGQGHPRVRHSVIRSTADPPESVYNE